jgi:excisionase family DNA binding protein
MASVLTDHQLARRLRIPLKWIREQVRAGNLPHLKIGRRVLFNPGAVEAAIARMASQFPQEPEAAHASS